MGVTVLPDWGPQLAKALANLGQGLGDIINPNAEFQNKFKEAVAGGDTGIMQRLTDYIHINGSLPPEIAKLVPKNLIDSLYINEPSPEAIRARAAIRANRGLSPGQTNVLGQSVLTGLPPTTAAVQLEEAPMISRLAGQPPGTVPTTLAEAGGQRALSGLSAGNEAADALKASLAPVAQSYLDDLKQKDAENTAAGHPTNYYQRAAAEQYDLLRDEHFRLTIDDRLMFMRLRHQDQIDAIKEHESNYWVNKSGGMGSPDLWRYLLYDPKAAQRLQEIRSSGPKNAEDATLLRMQNYRASDGANAERAFYTQSLVQRDKLFDAINGNPTKRIAPDDESRRPSDLAALNVELTREGVPIEAFWGQSADGSDTKTKLRFRLRLHKQIEVPPEQLQQAIQQADKTFSGSNLNIQQSRPAGAKQQAPRPAVTVTPRSGTNNAAGQYDLNTPAGYWEYLRSQDNVAPDSVITNRVKAKFNIR